MKRRLLQIILPLALFALPAYAVSPTFLQVYNALTNCDATLVQSTSGLLFGTTLSDGPAAAGSIFSASTNTMFRQGPGLTNLHTFTTSDGGQSDAGLALAPLGMLYATTARLAQSNNIFPGGMGSIYRISQTGSFAVLYRFGTLTNALGQPLDGASPRATPVTPLGVTLYGTTFLGGSSGYDDNGLGYGVVFSIQINGSAYSVLHSFSGADGANPTALTMGQDQSLYGVASFGGANSTLQTNGATGYGTIFNLTTNGTFSLLYSFGTLTNTDAVPLDGSEPNALFQASNGMFYGTAASGGAYGQGTFFSVTTNGTFTLLYSFGAVTNSAGVPLDGANPNGALIEGADANLYGVTQFGGSNNVGTVYRITPQGQLTTLFSFATNGFAVYNLFNPRGGLLLGRDTSFYGTTSAGRNSRFPATTGGIYKLGPGIPAFGIPSLNYAPPPRTNIAGATITYSNAVESVYPTAVQWLYKGTALTDNVTLPGSFTDLTLSNLTVADSGTYTLVASNAAGIAISTNLLTVVPALITTQPAGTNIAAGATNVFKVTPKSNLPFTCQWHFNGTNLNDSGRFSGATTTNLTLSGALLSDAGSYSAVISNSAGSVTSSNAILTVQPFLLITAPTNQYAVAGLPASLSVAVQNFGQISYQWQFNGTNLNDGGNISGSTANTLQLQPASVSDWGTYTVTVSNAVGVTNLSALLVVVPPTAPNCVVTNLQSFSYSTSWEPNQLDRGPDGVIYGTTVLGGAYHGQVVDPGNGTFFRVDTNGTVTTLHSFDGINDGVDPVGQLALSTNGSFFGIAENYNYQPTLINITTNGTVATLTVLSNVSYALGITMGSDGRLYGTDYYNHIFTVDPDSDSFAVLHAFGNSGYIYSVLTVGLDGLLYGTTGDSIFKMDYNANLTTNYTFANIAEGHDPSAYLAWATNGDLYGVTGTGGAYGYGTIFKLSTNAELTTLYSFGQRTNWDGTSVDGSYPASLIWGPDGMLYGPTLYGGCNNSGTVFRISADGTFETLVWFNSAIGSKPSLGQLVVGLDQNIYGTTSSGGPLGNGTIYRINLVPNTQSISASCDDTGTVTITAPTIPGHTYQLQYTSSLSPADWQNLNSPTTATLTSLTFADSPTDTQRFYRIVLVQ